MGGKARRIRNNVSKFLSDESESQHNADIAGVFKTIKKLLIADLTPETFADMCTHRRSSMACLWPGFTMKNRRPLFKSLQDRAK